jgi:hypothetical protein
VLQASARSSSTDASADDVDPPSAIRYDAYEPPPSKVEIPNMWLC